MTEEANIIYRKRHKCPTEPGLYYVKSFPVATSSATPYKLNNIVVAFVTNGKEGLVYSVGELFFGGKMTTDVESADWFGPVPECTELSE